MVTVKIKKEHLMINFLKVVNHGKSIGKIIKDIGHQNVVLKGVIKMQMMELMYIK